MMNQPNNNGNPSFDFSMLDYNGPGLGIGMNLNDGGGVNPGVEGNPFAAVGVKRYAPLISCGKYHDGRCTQQRRSG